MRLKQIELQGFKSFAEKTKIDFPAGLTVIIGPNGSGKSNISDAVRWVLGEMSLKTLRGSKMEDVIFNGTQKRQPAGYTSVSLYLDTSAEHDAAAGDVGAQAQDRIRLSDSPEVVITRRYYRTGESEYYINKKQVRLKDIYELFYDTGIGREGYSVIGQGKISEVLSAKGDERRSIFEEASGISKYRFRKTEAERKLRDTENNLVRIGDIVGELSARIGPLEKEAENAKKYLTLSEEKKGLEITLWLERTDKIRSEMGEREQNLAAAKLELELAEEDIKRLESEEERSAQEGYDLLRRKGETEAETSAADSEAAEAAGRRAVAENELGHLQKKVEDCEADRAAAVILLSGLADDESAARASLEKAKSELNDAENVKKQLAAAYNNAVFASDEASERAEDISKELENASERLSGFEIERAGLAARIESADKGDDGRLCASRQRVDELKSSSKKAEKELKIAVSACDGVKARIREAEELIRKLGGEKNAIDEKISAQKIKAASLEEQRDGLIRLDRLFEGYSGAVKTVMNASKDGRIKTERGDVRIHGTVASLLSTDGEYVVALETALGASVQFVIVETEADAKASIAFLKRTGGGRATFLPLDTVKGRKCDVSAIKNLPGYVGIASELALCDEKYTGIADELLGRTVIAADIDAASVIARKSGFRVKIVTKDGQVINAGGSYTGGSPAQKVGVFTRGVDIERLDAQIKEANNALFDLETSRRKITRRTEELQSSIAEEQESLEELTASCDSARSSYGGISARLEEEELRLRELEEAQSSSERSRSENEAKLKSAEAEAEDTKNRIILLKKELEEQRASVSSLKSAEAEALEKLNAFRVEEVKLASSVEASESRLAAVLQKKQEHTAKAEAAEAVIAESTAAVADLEKEIAFLDEKIADCSKKSRELATLKSELEAAYAEKEQRDSARRSEARTANTRRDQAFRVFTGLESGVEAQHKEYDTLITRLWDEYELTYSEAEEFRLPAEKMVKAQTRINYLKSQIKALGNINVNAVSEYAETKERYDFLTAQVEDLNKTRRSLDGVISRLNNTMRATFTETIERIDAAFSETFSELFGGGQGHIELQDPENPLECGIDIIIRPPGKSVKSISLLSGGEQSFAAIALYLALQQINPAPFCIFDEIESALDDVNLVRFVDYVKRRCEKTQYIMITHRRGTMERADTIYGVTMYEKGVSDYIKLDISKIEKYSDVK